MQKQREEQILSDLRRLPEEIQDEIAQFIRSCASEYAPHHPELKLIFGGKNSP